MSVLLSSEIPAIQMFTVFQDFSSLHLLTFPSPHFKRFQRLKNHMGGFSHSDHPTLATDFLMFAWLSLEYWEQCEGRKGLFLWFCFFLQSTVSDASVHHGEEGVAIEPLTSWQPAKRKGRDRKEPEQDYIPQGTTQQGLGPTFYFYPNNAIEL